MHKLLSLTLLIITSGGISAATAAEPASFGPQDWPWWRGPLRNGIADANQQLPEKWSATENVLWKASIPGRGHGSPIVVGDRVLLQTCNEQTGSQSLLCHHRHSGDLIWEKEIHASGAMKKNKKSSAASSTPACDGSRVFVNFPNDGAIYTTALTLDGERLWSKKITDYVIHQGYGSSPAIYDSLVIVSADNKGGGVIAALDRETGEFRWRVDRPKTPNYPSPVILEVAGKTQLLMTGCNLVSSYDPLTGDKLWEIEGSTTECVTSTITDGTHIYSSGGYPTDHISAVRADGSGKVDWTNKERIYVPSMIVRDGYLFGVMDAGVAGCWNAATGEEMWKARLGGNFTSSPVLVGDTIFATNETGKTYIYEADPQKYTLLGTNQLGEEMLATPTICGGRIYLRVASYQGDVRAETLYCLGETK